jgi:DNA-binding GntR family transcriptional regulator
MASGSIAESPVKTTRASQVAEHLRQAILRGQLRPGSKVSLDRLRAEYGVSLSPMREAIARLVPLGLVEAEDQRGYRIAPVSPDNLAEVTRLSADMEGLALGYAVRSAGIEWEGDVLGTLHRLGRNVESATGEAWEDALRDTRFALIRGCGLPMLIDLCRTLFDLNERYRRLLGQAASERQRTLDDLGRIAEASAVRRDGDEASALIRAHIERTGGDLAARITRET